MAVGHSVADRRRGDGALTAVVLIGCVGFLALMALAHWQKQLGISVGEARTWTIPGPPCPRLTREAYQASVVHVQREFSFGGAGFGRAYGHVSCSMILDNGGHGPGEHPVCQFTSPAVLHITTPRGEVYFFPNAGPATVSVLDGTPQCVLAGRFRG